MTYEATTCRIVMFHKSCSVITDCCFNIKVIQINTRITPNLGFNIVKCNYVVKFKCKLIFYHQDAYYLTRKYFLLYLRFKYINLNSIDVYILITNVAM